MLTSPTKPNNSPIQKEKYYIQIQSVPKACKPHLLIHTSQTIIINTKNICAQHKEN